MKTSINKILFVLAALAIYVPNANASLYVEPFVGYLAGKAKYSVGDDSVTGLDMGARLGFSNMGFAIAGEYARGAFDIDSDPSTDLEPTNMGIFVGFEFPVLIRVYGTYIVKSEGDYGTGEVEGDGFRLGVGFTGLPFIAINFEYYHAEYDEYTNSGVTVPTELTTDMYGVNVSLPLDLL